MQSLLPERRLSPREHKKLYSLTGLTNIEKCRFLAIVMVREFLYESAGLAYGPMGDRFFSDEFRDFVVGLTGPGMPCKGMTVDEISMVTGVPDDLVEEWLYFQ